MTWANVQQNAGGGTIPGAFTATVTVSTPTTAGNKVFIACVLQSLGTIVCSGFTKEVNPIITNSVSNQAILFSKDTAGGETSWSITGFTSTLNAIRWIVIEVSGLASGTSDKTALSSSTATPASSHGTGTTATTTSANELAVAVMGALVSSGSTTYTSWSNGFTQQGATGSQAVVSAVAFVAVAVLELTSAQTVSSTVAFSPNAAGMGGVATYVEAGGSPVNVNDHSGSVSAGGGTESLVVDCVLSDHPVAVAAGGPGQVLVIDRLVLDVPTTVLAAGGVESISLITPVALPDLPGAVVVAGPAQSLLIDRSVTDRAGAVQAFGPGQIVIVDRSASDRPSGVQASGPSTTLAIDRIVTDRPGTVLGHGGVESITLLTPVNVSDHPGAVSAAGTGQTLVFDRVLADRTTGVQTANPPTQLAVDRFVADHPTAVRAGGTGTTVSFVNPTTVTDRPGAVSTGTPGQIVVVDVIRPDRPTAVQAAGTPVVLAHNVTVTDRAWAVLAAGCATTVSTTDVLVGWPPLITGPFRAPLLVVSGPFRTSDTPPTPVHRGIYPDTGLYPG